MITTGSNEACKYCNRQLAEIGHTHTTRLEMNTFGGAQTLVAVCDPCPDHAQCAMKHIASRSAFIINYCPMCGRKLNITHEPKGDVAGCKTEK